MKIQPTVISKGKFLVLLGEKVDRRDLCEKEGREEKKKYNVFLFF